MADLGGGGGECSMGSVEPPFWPQIHPESPGNSVSDIPDFTPGPPYLVVLDPPQAYCNISGESAGGNLDFDHSWE